MGAYRAGWFARRTDVDQVLVGSRDAARAAAVAQPLGAEAGTYDDVLGADLDALVLSTATPNPAARGGGGVPRHLPTLCEKPIAPTVEETDRAVSAAERAGVPLQLSFQRRFDPGWREAKRLL